MNKQTKIIFAVALFALMAVVTFLQVERVEAVNAGGDTHNLCMCAPRRGAPPPPPNPPAPQPSQPEPANGGNGGGRDHDDDDPNPPAPPVCSPRYHGPTISLTGYTPDYPLVIGQDPDEMGVDVTLRAQGGSKSNGCNRGAARATITSFSLNGVSLSAEAIARIQGELSRAYPDAQVLDSYPLHPGTTYGGNGTSTTLAFHFNPLDPGDYDITVTARQSDGKQTTRTFQVPVHLLETTIGW